MDSTFELLEQLIKEYSEVSLTRESTLKDLKIDSVDLVEILLRIEEELGIRFEDDELFGLKSVQDVLNLVKTKL